MDLVVKYGVDWSITAGEKSNMDEDVILTDANYDGDAMPRPNLVFSPESGRIWIADDYETVNDLTARDITISKEAAIELASALLVYVRRGVTSELRSACRQDIEDRVGGLF
jgi:hypothetical protein